MVKYIFMPVQYVKKISFNKKRYIPNMDSHIGNKEQAQEFALYESFAFRKTEFSIINLPYPVRGVFKIRGWLKDSIRNTESISFARN